MPKSPTQNAMIKEKRKKEIMETALVLFANQGIDNVTVDNISQAMKISHGLFYHYFEDKEDLVNALIAKAKEIFLDNLKEINFDGDKDPLDLLKVVTNSLLKSINDKESTAYYLYLVLILNFQGQSEQKDFAYQLKNYLYNLIHQLRNSNVLKDIGDEEILTLYLSVLQGITYHKIKYKNQFITPTSESIIALFLK